MSIDLLKTRGALRRLLGEHNADPGIVLPADLIGRTFTFIPDSDASRRPPVPLSGTITGVDGPDTYAIGLGQVALTIEVSNRVFRGNPVIHLTATIPINGTDARWWLSTPDRDPRSGTLGHLVIRRNQ